MGSEELLMCQAGDAAACEDGVAASAALHRSSVAEALKEWAFVEQHTKCQCYGTGQHRSCLRCRAGDIIDKLAKAANSQSQIEEPALAGDEVSAASQSASLTPPNQDFEAKAREIVRTCLNSSQAFRDAWNEGDVDLLEIISQALLTASKDATERAARIAEQHSGLWDPETVEAIASAIRTQESS